MILDRIVAYKKKEIERRKATIPIDALAAKARTFSATSGRFKNSLKKPDGVSLIAEIKKASPSAGVIRKDFAPLVIAETYEHSGAAAISVLTDEHFFQGHLDVLKSVKRHVYLPILQKDFIVDAYQIFEAKAARADAILLIVGILDNAELTDFLDLAREVGLDVLVETHTAEEVDRALRAGAEIIGINNRNLETFTVDLSTTLNLCAGIPRHLVRVSESGIRTDEDVKRLEAAGIDAVLVGTAFMEAQDIGKRITQLLGSRP